MSIGKRRGTGGGPLLKFDARHGSFFRVDRNSNGEVEQTSIVDFKAVFDLANLEVGWIRFDAGTAPSFKMVRAGQDIGNAPSDKHRQGLRLRVRLAGDKGVAREFSSTAATLWNAIDRLHDEFERNRGKFSGKLPYVRPPSLSKSELCSASCSHRRLKSSAGSCRRPSWQSHRRRSLIRRKRMSTSMKRSSPSNDVAAACEWFESEAAAALCSSKEMCHGT